MNVGVGAEIGNIGGSSTSLDSPAGTTGFSPRFSFGISRLNVLGLGHTISLQTLVSTLEQRALLTYVAPEFLGNPKWSWQISGLFDLSNDIRTFASQRQEGSLQFAQKLSRANTMQYRYTYRDVDLFESEDSAPIWFRCSATGPRRIPFDGLHSRQARRSYRLAPWHVHQHRSGAGFQPLCDRKPALAASVARNSTYYSLTKSLVLARTTEFGLIERYAGLPDIPLAERFFGGGTFSNRAFPDFQAGPRDPITGFPVGGNALLMNTIELRFPLIGDNLGGVLFNDLGNVYSAVNKINLQFRQPNLQDFNYAVQGFGFGLRYRTPIGPVRVDFSFSPDSPRFYGCQGSLNQLIYCDVQGSNVPRTDQRIDVFQFHFSLGQAF